MELVYDSRQDKSWHDLMFQRLYKYMLHKWKLGTRKPEIVPNIYWFSGEERGNTWEIPEPSDNKKTLVIPTLDSL